MPLLKVAEFSSLSNDQLKATNSGRDLLVAVYELHCHLTLAYGINFHNHEMRVPGLTLYMPVSVGVVASTRAPLTPKFQIVHT